MSDVVEATAPDDTSARDEQRIARNVSIALPIVTIVGAVGVGAVLGPATGILFAAAGGLLGVIAILWGSLRILSGDAALPPDLEELDMRSQGADALSSRKKMLLRALKDLDNERAIGKLEADDYDQISAQYRNELKIVMTKIDEQLAPNRALAESAAREHLASAGIGTGYRGLPAAADASDELEATPPRAEKPVAKAPVEHRVECPKCNAKNEPDAKFCKECATKLVATANENADAS